MQINGMFGDRCLRNDGVTATEFIVVMVVVGVMLVGALAGIDVLYKAKVQAVIKDRAKLFSAITSFRNKYYALPGTMKDATSYWKDQGTVDGNGDKYIDGDERFRAWQHLSLSKLVQESYSGEHSDGVYVPGVNAPKAPYDDVVYSFAGRVGWRVEYKKGPRTKSLHLVAGRVDLQVNNEPIHGFLTPEEYVRIEDKIDDGLPGQGNVLHMGVKAKMNGLDKCIVNADNAEIAGVLTVNDDRNCHVVFVYAFGMN